MKVKSIFFLSLLWAGTALGQLPSEQLVWLQASEKISLNDPLSVTLLWQQRLFLERADVQQSIYWVSGDYKLNSISSLGGGLMYFTYTRPLEAEVKAVPELRPFQYLTIKRSLGAVKLSLRNMIEERYLSEVIQDEIIPNQRLEIRYRFRLKSTIPVARKSKVVLSTEYFINGGANQANRFSQNRAVALWQQKIGPVSMSAGYMHWLVNTSMGKEVRHSWQVQLHHSFDLRNGE